MARTRSLRDDVRAIRGREKGELEVSEYADFIALFYDLAEIPPSQYSKIRVVRTVVGGRTVHQPN